jgi:hypothetical protein
LEEEDEGKPDVEKICLGGEAVFGRRQESLAMTESIDAISLHMEKIYLDGKVLLLLQDLIFHFFFLSKSLAMAMLEFNICKLNFHFFIGSTFGGLVCILLNVLSCF